MKATAEQTYTIRLSILVDQYIEGKVTFPYFREEAEILVLEFVLEREKEKKNGKATH